MTRPKTSISPRLIENVSNWLQKEALGGADLEHLIAGFCERMASAGLPLSRVHLSFSMLHPLYVALGFTWKRGKGMSIEGFRPREDDESEPSRFLQSPYFYLLSNNLDHLRRRIDADTPSEFPVFDDLKSQGVTDYLAFVQSFNQGQGQGMVGSWATDAKEGFSEDVIEALLTIQNSLAVAAKMAVLSKLADNMLMTYLGSNVGKRVLSGQIRRGDGETIRAVLVMGDMRKSTTVAERDGRQTFIDTLNEFFDALATPFNRNGGEILSFMGDGFLAIYPCSRNREPSQEAARAAMSAVRMATAQMKDLNARRVKEGLEQIDYGIGLHIGNVMFGNVGLSDRLTFSAFGASVNEVERLQGLTKKYSRPIVASQGFVNYCGGEWVTLGDEQLRGTRQKLTVLTPAETLIALDKKDLLTNADPGMRSEAEQIMLLLRNSLSGRAGPGSGNGNVSDLREALQQRWSR